MKILYALQCTGNGHIARAHELIPAFREYAEVDLLASGHNSQIELPQRPAFRFEGISLFYDSKGGLSYSRTILKNNYLQLIKDAAKVPVENYDLIINDFEPVSAYACKWKKSPNIIGLSHQSSMLFAETPQPGKKDFIGKWVLRNFAPAGNHFGFHFQTYHPSIFNPVIRSGIRRLNPSKKGFYMVYLPGFSDDFLIEKLNGTLVEWKIFSKTADRIYTQANVSVFPIDQEEYLKSFESCEGILTSAGFETPAEALFLKKKLFVIPIKNQYEQECNCVALEKMGVPSSRYFDLGKILDWVNSANAIEIEFREETQKIVREVLNFGNWS